MKRRTIILMIMMFVLGIGFATCIIPYLNKRSIKQNTPNLKDDDLSIMVYDSATQNYDKSDTVPVGDYYLNAEKTYCINGEL